MRVRDFIFATTLSLSFAMFLISPVPGYAACADLDGDGHSDAACGGDDCDDSNPNRFPGRREICDPLAREADEDCDPGTFNDTDAYGNPQDGDMDRDGQVDFRCCNDFNGTRSCGIDCDDGNPAIQGGAMICKPGGASNEVQVCEVSDKLGQWIDDFCDPGLACVPQPNGIGLCFPEEDGFCGDHILDNNPFITEQCDDGNILNEDGCSALCQLEFCGDGIVQNDGLYTFEECDDANFGDGDGCDASCAKESDAGPPGPSSPPNDSGVSGEETELSGGCSLMRSARMGRMNSNSSR